MKLQARRAWLLAGIGVVAVEEREQEGEEGMFRGVLIRNGRYCLFSCILEEEEGLLNFFGWLVGWL